MKIMLIYILIISKSLIKSHSYISNLPTMEESNPKIHVLMVSFAAQGHINPLLRLAKHLHTKSNTIHVTIATTETLRHRILKQNHHTAASKLNSTSDVDFEFFSDGFDLDYDRKSNMETYMDTLAKVGPINLYNLIISLSRNQIAPKKFSCIICSAFVPWVVDVAVQLGVPCAMVWIQPCTLFSIYHSFYKSLTDFPTEENPDKSVAIPGLPLLQPCDLPPFVLPSNPLKSVAKLLSEALQNVDKFRWVLVNSFAELEKDVIDSLPGYVKIMPVGPLVPPTLLGCDHDDQLGLNLWLPDDTCIVWLNQQQPESVIYVSFGSLVALSKEQMMNIGKALINCKRPFLWVIKKPDNSVDEGAGELPEELFDEIKDQGLVVTWCPQDKVLSHDSVACFLTHCGWNSTLETISAGVPVIGYPFWSDQPTNAKLVSDVFGVGLRLWPDKDMVVEIEAIVKSIEEIMDGPKASEIRAKALEWKCVAREVVAVGGSSDRNIQEFVDEMLEISVGKEYDVSSSLELKSS